jgi:hypothetical protein
MLGTGVALLLGACTFPDFIVLPSGASGTAGTAAGAGTAGTTGSGTDAGAAGESTQGGTSNVAGSVNTAGEGPGTAGQGGDGDIPVDIGPCGQRPHPLHCQNHTKDVDESDVDCGGPRCPTCASDEACTRDRDCTSGSCEASSCTRLFTLQYVRQVDQTESPTIDFRVVLNYLGTDPQLLKDITVRYYFSRNGVTEPILAGVTSFEQPANMNISGGTSANIVRQLRGNGLTNDAYFELGFDEKAALVVTQGEELDLEGNATTGDGTSLFNQKTHYSFDAQTSLHENKQIVVYLKGQRAWGSPPPVDDPSTCFHLGVNLDGAAVTVGDDPWLGSPASVLARYIDESLALKPATDQGREDMIRSGFFFHGDSFAYATDNGTYELLAYAWSAAGSETGTLQVQGTDRDTFHATSFAGGSPWVALGPYRITIDKGQLTLAAKNDLRLGGFELRTIDE